MHVHRLARSSFDKNTKSKKTTERVYNFINVRIDKLRKQRIVSYLVIPGMYVYNDGRGEEIKTMP